MKRATLSFFFFRNPLFFHAILLFLISDLILPASFATEITRGQEAFQTAMQLRQQGDLFKAENALLEALKEEPANSDYHFELANIYAARYDNWREYPYHPEAQELLGRAAYQLEQAVMIRPDAIPALFNLGVVYKKRREYEEARKQFKKVLELDPKSIAAWMQIGAIYEDQGFFDEAEDAYKAAREIDFYNPEIISAIQDLKNSRAEYQKRQEMRDAEERRFFQREFRYAAFSQAQNYHRDRLTEADNRQGPVQALPYVAAMLIQQFMNRRIENKVNDS